jgi:hypothetical protein
MPVDVELVAVAYPGRLDRLGEPLIRNMRTMVEAVSQAIPKLEPMPTIVFGHSMGASIAHELVLRGSAQVDQLVVSARRPPSHLRVRDVYLRGEVAIMDDVVRLDPESAQILAIKELRDLVLPAIAADYELVATYAGGHRPMIDTPILALGGDSDPEATPDSLRSWSEATVSNFDTRTFPGGHFYLWEHPREVITTILDQ